MYIVIYVHAEESKIFINSKLVVHRELRTKDVNNYKICDSTVYNVAVFTLYKKCSVALLFSICIVFIAQ